jgi:hypothetical protein
MRQQALNRLDDGGGLSVRVAFMVAGAAGGRVDAVLFWNKQNWRRYMRQPLWHDPVPRCVEGGLLFIPHGHNGVVAAEQRESSTLVDPCFYWQVVVRQWSCNKRRFKKADWIDWIDWTGPCGESRLGKAVL